VINDPYVADDAVTQASERETLEGFLEYHRAVLVGKLRGLSEADVRRRLVPSRTTLIGLVQHVIGVERNWFQHYLAERPREEIDGDARGGADSWEVAEDRTVADVVAELDAVWAVSRRIVAGMALDATVPHEVHGRVSVRWVLLHVNREYARHIGHADILREQTDGGTGDVG